MMVLMFGLEGNPRKEDTVSENYEECDDRLCVMRLLHCVFFFQGQELTGSAFVEGDSWKCFSVVGSCSKSLASPNSVKERSES
jgi:hypothetical protein